MRTAIALATLSLLAACADGDQADEAGDAEAEAIIDDSGNGGDVRITSRDGKSVSIDRRTGNKAAWPKDFTAYPGAVVTSDIAMGGGDDSAKIITFESDDAPEDIVAHYRRQAEAAGYEIQLDLGENGGRMVAGEKPDGRGFSISTRASDSGTEASLTVGPKR